jgi:hypothetical protein
MKNYMPMKEIMVVVTMLCACEARSEIKQELFNKCVVSEGTNYLQAVSLLFQQQEARIFLSNLLVSSHVRLAEHRLAEILLRRMEEPQVFLDIAILITASRTKPDALSNRPGYLSGVFWSYSKKEPESKYVDEIDGSKMVGIIATQKYKKVLKYTDVDIQKGKSKNAIVRLAMIEYFMKFSIDFTPYEVIEMLDLLRRFECGQHGGYKGMKRPDSSVPTEDLVEAVVKDETRPLATRINAISLLNPEKWEKQTVNALMFKMFGDAPHDAKLLNINQRAAYIACEYFKCYGTVDDLARLKALQLKTEWQRELVHDAVKALNERVMKEQVGK